MRRSRARKSCSGEAVIELHSPGEGPREIDARLVDVSDFGAGFETNEPLEVGSRVTITSLFFDSRAEIDRRDARIVHCTLRARDVYRSGASFDTEEAAGSRGSLEDQAARAAHGLFVDYYEVLQISTNADVEMIERAHAVLRERYLSAPEGTKKQTSCRLVDEAHRVLHDPVLRAAYDVKHRQRAPQWQVFGKAADKNGDDELVIRRAILSLLYAARQKQSGPQGLTPKELEDLLLSPREHLEFSLWYLRGKGHVVVAAHERYAITPSGVDAAEGNEETPGPVLLQLEAPMPA